MTEVQKFRKKPVVIEALQLRWENWNQMCDFIDVGKLEDGRPQGCYIDKETGLAGATGCSNELGLSIPTLEGVMIAREYDWVIKGIKGEIYPCKPDIFEATYEPA